MEIRNSRENYKFEVYESKELRKIYGGKMHGGSDTSGICTDFLHLLGLCNRN